MVFTLLGDAYIGELVKKDSGKTSSGDRVEIRATKKAQVYS